MAFVGLIANFFDKALLAVIPPVYADGVYGSGDEPGPARRRLWGSVRCPAARFRRNRSELAAMADLPYGLHGGAPGDLRDFGHAPPLAVARLPRSWQASCTARSTRSSPRYPVAHASHDVGTRLRNRLSDRTCWRPGRSGTRRRGRSASRTHPHDRRDGIDLCRTNAHNVSQTGSSR